VTRKLPIWLVTLAMTGIACSGGGAAGHVGGWRGRDSWGERACADRADVPALHGWRRELFGEAALKVKRGDMALAMRKNQVVAIEA